MRNKYNVNMLDGIVKDFSTQHSAAWWTDVSEGGYFTAVYKKGEKIWIDTPGIDHSIADVIVWAKKLLGWRKAAQLKKAAWDVYCYDILIKNYHEYLRNTEKYHGWFYHRKNLEEWCKGARFRKEARNTYR